MKKIINEKVKQIHIFPKTSEKIYILDYSDRNHKSSINQQETLSSKLIMPQHLHQKQTRNQIYIFNAKENYLHSQSNTGIAQQPLFDKNCHRQLRQRILSMIPKQLASIIKISQNSNRTEQNQLIVQMSKQKQQPLPLSMKINKLINIIWKQVQVKQINIFLGRNLPFDPSFLKGIDQDKKNVKINYLTKKYCLENEQKNQTKQIRKQSNAQHFQTRLETQINDNIPNQKKLASNDLEHQYQIVQHQKANFSYLSSKKSQIESDPEEFEPQQQKSKENLSIKCLSVRKGTNLENQQFKLKISQQKFNYSLRRKSFTKEEFKMKKQKPRFTVIINSVSKSESSF